MPGATPHLVRIVVLALALCGLVAVPRSSARGQAEITCAQIIGYSTTSTWFPAAEAQLDGDHWQLLWNNGGSVNRWADPGYEGWGTGPVSPCANGSRAPDLVVLDVASGEYTGDVEAIEQDTRRAIDTIRMKYGSVRQIVLQPEHGGPDYTACPWSDAPFGVVRATYNHAALAAAIAHVVGGDVVSGPDPLVRTCGDFADSIGHLTDEGARALGASNGRFYAASFPSLRQQAPTAGARTSWPPAGKGSLSLRGQDAYAEAPNATELRSTADWTVEAWFLDENPDGYDHDRERIVTKGDTSSDEVPFFVDVSMGYLWAGRRVSSTSQVVFADLVAAGASAGSWHHLAATFDNTAFQLTLYLDGVLVAQGPATGYSRGNTSSITIGRNGGSDPSFWLGKVDEVRIWNIVRTADQIQAAWMSELSGDELGLVGYWRFNEAAGSVAADGARAPHDATLFGGADWSSESPLDPAPTTP